jgi:hypothetical protein
MVSITGKWLLYAKFKFSGHVAVIHNFFEATYGDFPGFWNPESLLNNSTLIFIQEKALTFF